MKIEIHNAIVEKAKVRKDGVYKHEGYFYAVKKGNFIAFCDNIGSVFSVHGVFNSQIGKVEIYHRIKALKEYLNKV